MTSGTVNESRHRRSILYNLCSHGLEHIQLFPQQCQGISLLSPAETSYTFRQGHLVIFTLFTGLQPEKYLVLPTVLNVRILT